MTSTLTPALAAAIAGLVTGLGLIIAIGAQNAFVLRQGLLRRHVGPVVAVCVTSDALLIVAGVAGIGGLLAAAPQAIEVARWAGVAFLTGYAALALRRAVAPAPQGLDAAGSPSGTGTLAKVVLTAAALTWLNPHVYLDTVILLGTTAQREGEALRWWFAGGAVVASTAWFTVLGFAASRAHRVLDRPGTWRVLDLLVGAMMLAVAARLALHPVA